MWHHQSKLQSPYYEFVKEGRKTLELRVNDEKRQAMKIGDIWKFEREHDWDNFDEYFYTTITNIRHYKSFKEAIEDVSSSDLNELLPYVNSVEDAIKIYEVFYNKEKEEKYGVVCFTLKIKK
jgi:ASC-1-like (ASCH) protein